MRTIRPSALVVALVTFSSGCSDDVVSIGDDEESRSSGSEQDGPEALIGYWDGYVEDYGFYDTSSDDTSPRVRLMLDDTGHGTLEVGDAAPIPPASDPDADYPPGRQVSPLGITPELVPGARYTALRLEIEAGRIRFGVKPEELYAGWCSLQTSVLVDSSEPYYQCVPLGALSWGGEQCYVQPDGQGPWLAMSCTKLGLCNSVCFCDESACGLPDRSESWSPPVFVDATLQDGGDLLVGTMRVNETTRLVLRLERREGEP
jgi:hypothetical protein